MCKIEYFRMLFLPLLPLLPPIPRRTHTDVAHIRAFSMWEYVTLWKEKENFQHRYFIELWNIYQDTSVFFYLKHWNWNETWLLRCNNIIEVDLNSLRVSKQLIIWATTTALHGTKICCFSFWNRLAFVLFNVYIISPGSTWGLLKSQYDY